MDPDEEWEDDCGDNIDAGHPFLPAVPTSSLVCEDIELELAADTTSEALVNNAGDDAGIDEADECQGVQESASGRTQLKKQESRPPVRSRDDVAAEVTLRRASFTAALASLAFMSAQADDAALQADVIALFPRELLLPFSRAERLGGSSGGLRVASFRDVTALMSFFLGLFRPVGYRDEVVSRPSQVHAALTCVPRLPPSWWRAVVGDDSRSAAVIATPHRGTLFTRGEDVQDSKAAAHSSARGSTSAGTIESAAALLAAFACRRDAASLRSLLAHSLKHGTGTAARSTTGPSTPGAAAGGRATYEIPVRPVQMVLLAAALLRGLKVPLRIVAVHDEPDAQRQ